MFDMITAFMNLEIFGLWQKKYIKLVSSTPPTMFKQTILNYVCCRHTEDVQLNFEIEKVIFD